MTTRAQAKGPPRNSLTATAILAACLLSSTAAFAQFTGPNQTNIISGVIIDYGDDYLINNPFDQLQVTTAGVLTNFRGYIGYVVSASNTSAVVSNSGSLWYNDGNLYVGNSGASSQLVITNGGVVYNDPNGYLGFNASSSNNTALVIGTGSVWSNQTGLYVGSSGASNQLVISNGGAVYSSSGFIGYNSTSTRNSVSVSGSGSIWRNSGTLCVGNSGTSNQLIIAGNGSVVANGLYVGFNTSSAGNEVAVLGGGLFVTNVSGTATADVRRGAMTLSSGTVTVDGLTLTNGASGTISFSGGALITKSTTVSNGLPFIVGNSTDAATLNLLGGTHTFINGLDILRGTLTLNSGTARVDRLTLTNGANSAMVFTGGVLITQSTAVTNGVPVTIGDGIHTATLNLLGGTHSFANGLVITNNAILTGTGTISSDVTLAGILAPGSSPGTITNSGNLTVKSSAVLNFDLGTNSDLVVVGGNLTLGGTLNVSDAGSFGATNVYTLLTYNGSLLGGSLAVGTYPYSNVISGVTIDTSVPHKVSLNIGTILAIGANFTATTSTQSLVATFTDTSTGLITNWYWQFGDLNSTNLAATVTNLPHTYASFGNYNVTLIVSGATGSGTNTQQIHVGPLPLDPYTAWAQQYFPCYPPCPQGAGTADPDGDGVSNTNEFLLGTIPTSSVSVFRITSIVQNGNDIVITWQTAGGRTNVVQAMNGGTTGYVASNLQDIGQPIIVSGSGDTTANYTDFGGATNTPTRFYRVRLVTGQAISTNSAAFRITAIAREDNDIRITWMTDIGKTNALQATSGEVNGSYSTNDFTDLFAVTNTTATVTNYLDVGAATKFPSQFYRVRLVP